VGRGEVLELVHEQHPGRALHPEAKDRIGEESLDGTCHLLVEVHHGPVGELLAVKRATRSRSETSGNSSSTLAG